MDIRNIWYVTKMHNKSYKQIFTFHWREHTTFLISDIWAGKYKISQMATFISIPLNKSLFDYWLNSFKISNSKKWNVHDKAKFPAAKTNFQIKHLVSFSCLSLQTKDQVDISLLSRKKQAWSGPLITCCQVNY